MIKEGIKFVLRLNTSNKPKILTERGEQILLTINQDERVIHRGVYYHGLEVNLIGIWDKGMRELI